MKKQWISWSPFAALALIAAVSAGAQQTAQPKVECGSFPKESSQLPCVPNRISIIYPTALDAEYGLWEARTADGTLVAREEVFFSGQRGVSVFDREKVQGSCTNGTVDLANTCALWKPGSYSLQWVTSDGTPRIGPIHLEIRQPQGQDKVVFDTLIVPRISNPRHGMDILGLAFGGNPLWDGRPPVMDRVLAEFPEAEYAGYFLLRGQGGSLSYKGGGEFLESAAKLPNLNAEQRDRYWAIPEAAPPAMKEEKRQSIRRSYVDSVIKGQRYLELYPQFPAAAFLRVKIACELFNLDRPEEALREVEAAAKLTGPFAEEAKAFLAARAAKNMPALVTPGQPKAPELTPGTEQPKS